MCARRGSSLGACCSPPSTTTEARPTLAVLLGLNTLPRALLIPTKLARVVAGAAAGHAAMGRRSRGRLGGDHRRVGLVGEVTVPVEDLDTCAWDRGLGPLRGIDDVSDAVRSGEQEVAGGDRVELPGTVDPVLLDPGARRTVGAAARHRGTAVQRVVRRPRRRSSAGCRTDEHRHGYAASWSPTARAASMRSIDPIE